MLSACGSKPEFELVEQDPKIRIQFEMLNDGQSVDIGDRFVDQNEFNLQLKTYETSLPIPYTRVIGKC